MLWFIKHSHWCSMDIDASRHTIHYGDPEGDRAPDWLREVTNWWLSKHVEAKFDWEVLPCSTQRDGFSCGILAMNGLAHSFLPAVYPLIDTSSGQDGTIARLQAGAQVIQWHIQMVGCLEPILIIVLSSFV